MAAVTKLKAIKTTHLSHVSRVVNTLETRLTDDPPDRSSISKYLKMLEEKFAKVITDSENLQEVLTDPADLETEINDIDQWEDKIIDIKHRATELLELIETKPQANKDALNVTLGLMERLTEDHRNERKSLLPTIELPHFDGDLEKYEEFIDSFEAIVENHPGIQDVEKFIFLKLHLEKDAKDLLEGFSTTNKEYGEAFKLFKDTYGKKSLLKQVKISKLLNIEPCDGKHSLRSTYNQIRSLEGLEIDAEDHSLFLNPIVLSKLPRDIIKKWYRKHNDSINHLLQFIQEEVESTESAIFLEDAFATTMSNTSTVEKKHSKSNSHKTQTGKNRHQSNYKISE